MNNRTITKPKNNNTTTFLPVLGKKLSGQTFTSEPANEASDVPNPKFGYNFGDIQVESNQSFKQNCSSIIQTKLKIGQPNDKYEQEADKVAEQVMRIPDPLSQVSEQVSVKAQTGHVQKKCAKCEEEDEEQIQRKPLVSKITPMIQRQTEEDDDEKDEEEEEGVVQTKQDNGQSSRSNPEFNANIQSLHGSGQPLPESTRSYFESRFGHNFSNVRVHNDALSSNSARSINAKAYTIGSDIVFGTGHYAPEKSDGRELLAHELTHVIQQRRMPSDSVINKQAETVESSEKVHANKDNFLTVLSENHVESNQSIDRPCTPRIQTKLKIGKPNDKYEQEADKVAEQVMRMPDPRFQVSEQFSVKAQTTQIQRKCVKCEEEEEEQIQRKPIISKITPMIQRQTEEDEKEKEDEEDIVQTKHDSGQPSRITQELTINTQSQLGDGKPLTESTRSFFESRFGYDFRQVRIHSGAQAAQLTRSVNAKAFTVGQDILFGRGQYAPESSEGKKLVAHELTHTIQQKSDLNKSKPIIQRKQSQGYAGQCPKSHFKFNFIGVVIVPASRKGEIPTIYHSVGSTKQPVKKLEEGTTLFIGKWSDEERIRLGKLTDWWWPVCYEPEASDKWEGGYIPNAFIVDERKQKIKRNKKSKRNFIIKGHGVQVYREIGKPLTPSNKDYFIPPKTKIRIVKAKKIKGVKWLMVKIINQDKELAVLFNRNLGQSIRAYIKQSELKADQIVQKKPKEIVEEKPTETPEKSVDDPQISSVSNTECRSGLLNWIEEKVPDFLKKGVVWIKNQLKSLQQKLSKLRGYSLFTVILGRDPVTCEAVPRSATNLVCGFLHLLGDRGKKLCDDLKKSKAIEKALSYVKQKWNNLKFTWPYFKKLLEKAINSISISASDLLSPVKVFGNIFNQIKAVLSEPLIKVTDFAKDIAKKAGEIIIKAIILVLPFGKKVMGVIKKAGSVIGNIFDNPLAFANNIWKAVKLGVSKFIKNIATYSKTALFGWLFGKVEGELNLPNKFNIAGIIDVLLQIFNLTYAAIRKPLVKEFGEPIIQKVESGVKWLKIVVKEGLAAAWEHLLKNAKNLVDKIITGMKEKVIEGLVTAGIKTLTGLLAPPLSGIIQIVTKVYNFIKTLIEKLDEIIDFVNSVFGSIEKIALGKVDDAAEFIAKGMGKGLKLLLAFVAGVVGLGGIPKKIRDVIETIRKPIKKAINAAIKLIKKAAKGALKAGKKAISGFGKIKAWFSKSFSIGGKERTLLVADHRGTLTLMIRSSPESPVTSFLDKYEKNNATQLNQKKKKNIIKARKLIKEGINPLIKKIQDITTKNKNKPEIKLKKLLKKDRKKLVSKEGELAKLLNQILGKQAQSVWPQGTKEDPIPIKWYKPDSIYPKVGGKKIGEKVTLPKTKRNSSRTLEVSSANRLREGKILKRRKPGRPNDPKKDDIKRRLDIEQEKPNGLKVSQPKYAIDHVRDLAWMGIDEYSNLWPLDRDKNNAVNASHNQYTRAIVNNKEETHSAKSWGTNKHFWIAKVVSPPSKPGGHGTGPKKPMNSGKGGVPKRKP